MSRIIESKAVFGAAGGGIGGALASFLLWLLGITVWHAPAAAASADVATAAVPAPVAGLLLTLLPAGLGLLGGYLAPHTSRPDVAPASETSAPVAAPAPVFPPTTTTGTGILTVPPGQVTVTNTDLGDSPTVTA